MSNERGRVWPRERAQETSCTLTVTRWRRRYVMNFEKSIGPEQRYAIDWDEHLTVSRGAG